MMKTLRYIVLLVSCTIFLIAGSLLTFTQDTVEDDHTEADPELIERGYEVFTTNGCIACHGLNGEGNDVGPALGGHSEFSIKRQVRAPTNVMLVYTPEQIPTEDLNALVAYISSLPIEESEDGHEHDQSVVAPGDIVFAHHWLVYLALEADDRDDALHHAAHIIPYIDGIHLPRMQEVIGALAKEDYDTARQIVEPMVTDVGSFSHDAGIIYLQVGLLALEADDADTAIHFLTDYPRHEAEDTAFSENILKYIRDGELGEAAELIESRLGDETEFYPGVGHEEGEEHMGENHMDADHADSDDDHTDDDHADADDTHMDDDHADADDDHTDDDHADSNDDHTDDDRADSDDAPADDDHADSDDGHGD